MPTPPDYRNPFPGLRAFEAQEDIYFFGREKQVDELLRKLRTVRFLAVIGSSGSGKSSLIKSGLIPALHSGFMVGVSSSWSLCSFRPGNNPIGNLARALAQDGVLYKVEPEDENTYLAIIESTLRRSNNGLVEACQQSGAAGNNLLILVDQFEELFRFSSYEKEAKEGKRDSVAFINLLLKAVAQKDFPVYIVFTMRSDFLGDCTAFRGLPEKMNEGQYLVPRMSREEKKEAIAGPIAVEGGSITPRLLNRLLNDVGENPDQLPILQHAMMRTWNVWKESKTPGPAIDISDYEEAGTMRFALSRHAEEAFEELGTPEKKKACEIMFKALTDREAGARGIRRPRSVAEIVALTHLPTATQLEIIDMFRQQGRGFLMPAEEVALDADSIIDIAHESLMRGWNRLITWVDEEEQAAKIYLRLCEAADQYELGNTGLWREPELQIALKWEEEATPDAAWAARYNNQFYKAKLFLEHSKNQYEQERRYKEEMQKQRLRRAGRIIAVVGLVAVVAFLLAIYALSQKNIADRQTRLAKTSEASANQSAVFATKQQRIAVQQQAAAEKSARIADKEKKKALSSEEEAKTQTTLALREKSEANLSRDIAKTEKQAALSAKRWAEHARRTAEKETRRAEKETQRAEKNQQVADRQTWETNRLKNLSEARNLATYSVSLFDEKRLQESRDTAMLAYRLNDKNDGPLQNKEIYNALSRNWSVSRRHTIALHQSPVRSIAIAPAGRFLYSLDESGTLCQYAISDNGLQKTNSVKTTDHARCLALSPDGSSLVVLSSGGTGTCISTDGSKLKQSSKLTFPGIGKAAAFLNPTECVILTSLGIGKYQATAKQQLLDFIPLPQASAFCIDKNGSILLAIGSRIRIVKSWADLTKTSMADFACSGQISAIGADASGRYLAAGTTSGNLCLKDLQTGKFVSLQLHVSAVNEIQFMKTGPSLRLATAGADHSVHMVDVKAVFTKRNEEDILTLVGHSSWVYAIAHTPDGLNLYSAGEDQKIIAWKTTMKGLYDALSLSKN